MGKATIGLILKDNKVVLQMRMEEISQSELSLIITHLESLNQDLLSKFKKGVKKVSKDGK